QARLALRGAADRAAALGSHEQAASYLAQAAELSPDAVERALLLERQATEADLAGRYERGLAAARAAVQFYEQQGETAAAARARGVLGTLLIHAQHIQEAIAELEPAVAALPQDTDPQVRADVMAKLARAYYRNLEAQRSVDAAEEALVIAERHALRRTAAEAMVTKGTALSMLSRHHEATALLLGGMELARREGDIATTLRAAANASYMVASQQSGDEALRIARDALALARTVGDLGQIVWQAGNIAVGSTYSGLPLDPVLAEVDEVRALELEPADLHQLSERSFVPAMFRGRDVGDELEQWAAEARQRGDPQTIATAHTLMAQWAVARSDYRTASMEFEANARLRPDVGGLSWAAFFAALDGDAARARTLLEQAKAGPFGGPAEQAARSATSGLLAAFGANTNEALPAFREALRLLRGIEARLETGFVALAMGRTLDAGILEVRQALEEALATYERMGSEPMISQVKELLAKPEPAVPASLQPATEAEPEPAR
ncbi:MAG TPA: hypothetical protein VMP67_09015, partial [Candidatus Limnocylindria bacterium]|nr:hypothetical protein [Candidatus Limnocylindria bacterium]